jgi:hypothetical protein
MTVRKQKFERVLSIKMLMMEVLQKSKEKQLYACYGGI